LEYKSKYTVFFQRYFPDSYLDKEEEKPK